MARAQSYVYTNNLKGALADLNFAIDKEEHKTSSEFMSGLSGHKIDLYRARAVVYQKLGKRDLALRDSQSLKRIQTQAMQTLPFRWTP